MVIRSVVDCLMGFMVLCFADFYGEEGVIHPVFPLQDFFGVSHRGFQLPRFFAFEHDYGSLGA